MPLEVVLPPEALATEVAAWQNGAALVTNMVPLLNFGPTNLTTFAADFRRPLLVP